MGHEPYKREAPARIFLKITSYREMSAYLNMNKKKKDSLKCSA